jgi:CheY-like chemotaxis protein
VILDLLMPVMNGTEFLARCADTPALAALPVIVLTATDSLVTDRVPIFKKPVNLDSLMAHISAVCGDASDAH